MNRTIALIAVLVGAPLAVSGWIKWIHDPRIIRDAGANQSRDSLDRIIRQLTAQNAQRATVNHQLQDSIDRLETRVDRSARARVDAVRVAGDSLEMLARHATTDSARMRLDEEALAKKDTVILALLVQRDVLLQDVALLHHQLVLRDTTIAQMGPVLEQALRERDQWRRIARPPFVIRLLHDLPKYLLGGGLGWALKGLL